MGRKRSKHIDSVALELQYSSREVCPASNTLDRPWGGNKVLFLRHLQKASGLSHCSKTDTHRNVSGSFTKQPATNRQRGSPQPRAASA